MNYQLQSTNTLSNLPFYRLGGESLAVAQNAYAVIWFKGKELNMVFGLLLSISRVVSASFTLRYDMMFVW